MLTDKENSNQKNLFHFPSFEYFLEPEKAVWEIEGTAVIFSINFLLPYEQRHNVERQNVLYLPLKAPNLTFERLSKESLLALFSKAGRYIIFSSDVRFLNSSKVKHSRI